MSDEIRKQLEDALSVVRNATETIESKCGGIAEAKEQAEKANKKLDELEEKSQKMFLESERKENERKDMEERLKELESKAAKGTAVVMTSAEEKAVALNVEIKACEKFLKKDYRDMDSDDQKEVKNYLRTDDNVQGGFLVREAYDDMIIKPITEMDPIRSVARIKRIDANSVRMALRSSLVTSYWTGEGEGFTDSNSTYARPEIPVHSMTTKTPITNRELLASTFDMDNEIMSDFRESRMQLEGESFVEGDGSHKPRGFLDATAGNGGLTNKNASGSSTYDYDDLITLTGELKAGYNPIYGMNRKELAFIRTLKDDAGSYVWRAGNLGAGVPNQINGLGYVVIPSMPDKATNATPIVFADFRAMYTIVDSWQAIMLRNPYKEDGKVIFSLEGWVGGDVVLNEAGVLLKTVA
jgi:HK97 family phage major capsid protein